MVSLLTKRGQSTTSIQQNLVATRKVFNYAHGLNLIGNLPKFPTITIKQHPRGSFTVTEYMSLVRLSRQRIGQRIPTEFTVNSRRGELNLDSVNLFSALRTY
jgi:hypothetical protein